MGDPINHPPHYTVGSIEVYDFIESWNLNFTIGNVVKYVTRSPYKLDALGDLKKAKWYLDRAIEREERKIAEKVSSVLSGQNTESGAQGGKFPQYMYGSICGRDGSMMDTKDTILPGPPGSVRLVDLGEVDGA